LAGKRIATSYPNLLRQYLSEHGVQAGIVVLNGAVEIAPKLGTADCICDLVSSGATLIANQLKEVAVILKSEAILIGTAKPLLDTRGQWMETLRRRLEGVLRVRESKLLSFTTARASLPQLIRLLPDADLPMVMQLDGADDALAVQAVCHRAVSWQHLEELKRAGASHILVMPVEKMLA
jgi:ATP phosphoribosyltransferase